MTQDNTANNLNASDAPKEEVAALEAMFNNFMISMKTPHTESVAETILAAESGSGGIKSLHQIAVATTTLRGRISNVEDIHSLSEIQPHEVHDSKVAEYIANHQQMKAEREAAALHNLPELNIPKVTKAYDLPVNGNEQPLTVPAA